MSSAAVGTANEVGRQLDQINNFVASGVDAIIVTAVDTDAAQALSNAASAAAIPLIYANLQPANLADPPEKQAFVGANEVESGTMAAFEACRLLREAGKGNGATGYVMIGSLSMIQAGVATELHVRPGAFHGFDNTVPGAAPTRAHNLDLLNALRGSFGASPRVCGPSLIAT